MAPRRTLINVAAAAEILSVSEETVRNLVKAGKLPAYQINAKLTRFDVEDVYSYLESRRVQAAALRRNTRQLRPSQQRACPYKPGDKVV